MKIRLMTEADVPAAARLESECMENPWSEKIFRESLALSYYTFLAAEGPDGEIVGYAGLMNLSGEGDVTNIVVSRKVRRKGIGETLLRELMKLGREQGITDFSLEVRKSNLPAVSLYEKLGFAVEGLRKGYYEKPAEDALIMWKHESGAGPV